jgi:hypothetical protein
VRPPGSASRGAWSKCSWAGRCTAVKTDHTDAARDIARDLSESAAQLASLEGEAMNWLSDLNYASLRLRLENAHAAVEASRRVRLKNEDRSR